MPNNKNTTICIKIKNKLSSSHKKLKNSFYEKLSIFFVEINLLLYFNKWICMTSRICRSVVGRFAKSDPEPIVKVRVSKTDKRTAKDTFVWVLLYYYHIQQLKFKVPCSDNSATHLAVRFWKATTMGPDSIPDRFPAYLFIQTQPML